MFTTIKYLQTLFPFHKARAIYTPLPTEAGEDALQVGMGRFTHPSFPFIPPLKSSRLISILNMFSKDAPTTLKQM